MSRAIIAEVPPDQLPGRSPALLFAHRGAGAHERPNTSEAFRLALRLGADGIHTEAHRTADGIVVVTEGGLGPWRRRRAARLERAALPPTTVEVDELVEMLPTGSHLMLDLGDDDAVASLVASTAAGSASTTVWLVHHDLRRLAAWRRDAPSVRLVDRSRLRDLAEGPERRAATLREERIDAIMMDSGDWTGGLVALFRRFGRLSMARGVEHERGAGELLGIGIDAVSSPHIDRVVDASNRLRDSRRG